MQRRSRIAALTAVCLLVSAPLVARSQTITFSTLASFPNGVYGSPGPLGADPTGSVVEDSQGNLYGSTQAGGAHGEGAVYKVDTTNHLTVLYSFTGGSDGSGPNGDLVLDSNGYLYGVTGEGGYYGVGEVFRLSTHTSNPAIQVLYSFQEGPGGANPRSGVALDGYGNLFGAAQNWPDGSGTLYELSPRTKGPWLYRVIHAFTGGADGAYPNGTLYVDGSGNVYGTCSAGGAYGNGTVFGVYPQGGFSTLWSFTGGFDGANPQAPLTPDGNGGFYGTTTYGGAGNQGTIFDLTPAGWGLFAMNVLHSFKADGSEGTSTNGSVTASWYGLFGTAQYGGANDLGTVWRLDYANNLSIVHNFTDTGDGGHPVCSLWRDSSGYLFGTTASTPTGWGTVFKVTP